jgi:hypothetical protein
VRGVKQKRVRRERIVPGAESEGIGLLHSYMPCLLGKKSLLPKARTGRVPTEEVGYGV